LLRNGVFYVVLAAGTYTEGLYISGLKSRHKIIVQGPDVGGSPNTPTAIIDGTSAAAQAGLYFAKGMNVQVQEFFEILNPTHLLDAYGNDRTGVAYVAGTVVNIKSFYQFQYAIIGLYNNPVVSEDAYNSWVAVSHRYAIIYEAARVVFKQIGFDEQSTQFQALVTEQLAEVKASNIISVGY